MSDSGLFGRVHFVFECAVVSVGQVALVAQEYVEYVVTVLEKYDQCYKTLYCQDCGYSGERVHIPLCIYYLFWGNRFLLGGPFYPEVVEVALGQEKG